MPTSKPLVLAVLLITAAHAAAAESALELWETWYSVSARVRTKAIDADLEAGGRLAMAGLAGPSGQLTLRLRDVLEPPWKLYWVDPLGPAGKEVKVASVVTLREASWDALEAAQAESAAAAAVRHRRWLATAQRPRELDGSFAFVVIGDAPERVRHRDRLRRQRGNSDQSNDRSLAARSIRPIRGSIGTRVSWNQPIRG